MDLLYHFTQRNDQFPDLSPKEKFYHILDECVIRAFPNKGFFHNKEEMPPTVSFTGLSIYDLQPVIERRSDYGICFKPSYMKARKVKPVKYLKNDEIRGKEFTQDEKWLIDLKGNSYNFSWEKEYRHKGDFVFSLDKVFFVMAPVLEGNNIISKFSQLEDKILSPEIVYDTRKTLAYLTGEKIFLEKTDDEVKKGIEFLHKNYGSYDIDSLVRYLQEA